MALRGAVRVVLAFILFLILLPNLDVLAQPAGPPTVPGLPDPQLGTATVQNITQQISFVISLNTRIDQFQTTAAYNSWVTGQTDNQGNPYPAGLPPVATDARKTDYANLITSNTATLMQLQYSPTARNMNSYPTHLGQYVKISRND